MPRIRVPSFAIRYNTNGYHCLDSGLAHGGHANDHVRQLLADALSVLAAADARQDDGAT